MILEHDSTRSDWSWEVVVLWWFISYLGDIWDEGGREGGREGEGGREREGGRGRGEREGENERVCIITCCKGSLFTWACTVQCTYMYM